MSGFASRCIGRPVRGSLAGGLVAHSPWTTASGPVAAQPWTFNAQPIEVLGASAGIVHQMSSAGRRSLAVSGRSVAVVWDDKHAGIPRAYLALKEPNTAAFAPAIQISGDGDAFEPAVAALPDRRFWEDKRNFRHGYDVYAGHFGPDGFGPNERVQDDFGELSAQWHLSTAGHPGGTLVVAWTDEHEGQGDILLSCYADGTWSEDLPLPGA